MTNDPFGELIEENPDSGGKKKLEHFGETSANTLEHFGETGATEELHDLRPGGGSKLKHFGETQATPELENFGETTATPELQNFGETGATQELQNFGETQGTQELRNFGETSATPELENFGETAENRLQNFGETAGTQALTDLDATRDERSPVFDEEPSSRGPVRRSDNEENLYAVVGDQPEPDSGRTAELGTMDMSPEDILGGRGGDAAEKTADLSPDEFLKEGAEALTMNEGRDVVSGEATADLREVSEPPPLDADEAARREEEDGGKTADLGEAGDVAAEGAPESEDTGEEPDFLYGDRFSDKFKVPTGPAPKPSKMPQIVAAAGGLILVGVIAVVIFQFSSGPREFQGVEGVKVVKPTAPPTPVLPSVKELPIPPKRQPGVEVGGVPGEGGESTPVEVKKPVVDEPPPLPPATDPIDQKLRRAMSWGLPIEAQKPATEQGGGK